MDAGNSQEALTQRKAELRKALDCIHGQMVPLESQVRMLSQQYDANYREYVKVDVALAKLDGRFKVCRPHTSGRKHEPSRQDVTKVLTNEQLDALILKLEAEIQAREQQS